jgi:CheY-like chemotaxis protein/DNA-binding Xre family transcriptional regulator
MRPAISKKFIGSWIRSHRSERGLSQEELAQRAGLHRTYISDLERGARNPTLDSLDRLAAALDISIASLFERGEKGPVASGAPDDLVEVLLVEDNMRDAELTLRAFRKARLKNSVHIVSDGAEALDFIFAKGAYASQPGHTVPGLILLDLNLPKINGIEVLRRVKASEKTRHIAVIMLTVSSNNRDIAECRRLGAEGYIVKPVGFQNFSEATPALRLEWALMKPLRVDAGGTGRHESKSH